MNMQVCVKVQIKRLVNVEISSIIVSLSLKSLDSCLHTSQSVLSQTPMGTHNPLAVSPSGSDLLDFGPISDLNKKIPYIWSDKPPKSLIKSDLLLQVQVVQII